jgi:hypothetical protein
VELHFEGRLGLTPLTASTPAKEDEAHALTVAPSELGVKELIGLTPWLIMTCHNCSLT